MIQVQSHKTLDSICYNYTYLWNEFNLDRIASILGGIYYGIRAILQGELTKGVKNEIVVYYQLKTNSIRRS